MLSIQTNVNSLVAQQNLTTNTQFQSNTIQQLTSGYRINISGDDAAGLAVANQFRSSVAEVTQGIANGNDGLSQLHIMDGGMNNISRILDRLKTLATQSASGTFTGDRNTLNTEFQNDIGEIDRQAQAIGLNTGGTFAKSLSVFIGGGGGTTSASTLANGIVTVDLVKSTIDAQSLGLKGMQAVNVTQNADGTTSVAGGANQGLGATSSTSVAKIVANTSGTNPNAQALAGHALFQFSGAGFSDAGKVGVSVNLDGVSDTASLATALNSAIANSGNLGTAAANAFKAAVFSASVYKDTAGKEAIAFTSSGSAFQVQAGDQMANALLGNVTLQGVDSDIPQGNAVSTSTTAGVTTTTGTIDANKTKLVVTGGGLASAVTLTLNSGSTTTAAAIADLMGQFTSNNALVNAGITLTNTASGTSVGGRLGFTSASGQSFNIQMTGDTNNHLGLGSFITDSSNNADYKTIDASGYSASAIQGVSLGVTIGTADLEISLNGAQSVALTGIDLKAGASATAASVTSTTAITPADITAGASDHLIIDVYNNGVQTNRTFNLTASTAATAAALGGGTTAGAYTPLTISAVSTNNTFVLAYDNVAAKTITIGDNTYATLGDLVAAISIGLSAAGITVGQVSVGIDASTHKLTFTSASKSAGSYVSISGDGALGGLTKIGWSAAAANGTADAPATADSVATEMQKQFDAQAVSTLTAGAAVGIVVTAGANDKFIVTLDGTAKTITIGAATYATAGDFLAAVNTALTQAGLSAKMSAVWAGGAGGTGGLTLVSSTSAGSTVVVSTITLGGGTVNGGFAKMGFDPTLAGVTNARTAVVTASSDGKITIASAVKGANSEVSIDAASTADSMLNLAGTVRGTNSSLTDIRDNLNAQFAASTTWQQAGLKAVSDGSTQITITSNNGTQFRLNSLASTVVGQTAANIGFGNIGTSFAAANATANAATAMSSVDAYGTSATAAQTFNALQFGNEKQVLTFSANDNAGAMETKSITLENNVADGNRSGRSIDDAVAYINSQLQAATTNPALQKIVAVKDNSSGEKIVFVSSLAKFSVGVGQTGTTDGLNGGVSGVLAGTAHGSASNMSIDTQLGAQDAVQAIATAVKSLGTAQAAVGIGENQLGYAINLAQSQVTNFSSAEAQIRDANVAMQAANLSKAQVLQQASIAAMAQANSAPQAVLKLLG